MMEKWRVFLTETVERNRGDCSTQLYCTVLVSFSTAIATNKTLRIILSSQPLQYLAVTTDTLISN